MPDREIIVHVGYPKTGTTTLQAGLFPDLPEIDFLGKFTKRTASDRHFDVDWMDDFRTLVNFGAGHHVTDRADEIGQKLSERLARSSSGRVLISLEGFTNPVVDTHWPQAKDPFQKAAHLHLLLDAQIRAGTRVHIFVTVRDQRSLIPSLFAQVYLQTVRCGLCEGGFDGFLDFMFTDRVTGFGPVFFYDRMANAYAGLFGRENVSVADMSGLFSGASGVDTVARLLAVDEDHVLSRLAGPQKNIRKDASKEAVRYKMMTGYANVRAPRHVLRAAGFSLREQLQIRQGKSVFWSVPDRSEKIGAYYAASNQGLLDMWNVDVSPPR